MKYIVSMMFGMIMMLIATVATAGIVGTPHDLSQKSYGSTEVCIFCHTPHNAQIAIGAPLWNHAQTVATFTTYSSSTLNAVILQPSGNSKLCLSCHDGSVAVDSYGNNAGNHMMDPGGAKIGTDLSNDHPISFVYDGALATADGGLKTPISDKFVDAASVLPLYNSQMQCASCHSVHSNQNGKFLRMVNTGSQLCLSCHVK